MKYLFGAGRRGPCRTACSCRGCCCTCVFALGPSLATVVYSLTDTNGLTPAPLNFIGLDNYREFLFVAPRRGRTSRPWSGRSSSASS